MTALATYYPHLAHKLECDSKAATDIVLATIHALLADSDWTVTVNDGEEDTVAGSRDPDQIVRALCTTDHDYLRVYRKSDGRCMGWVLLIYENGCDVISNYTCTLGDALQPALEVAEDY